MSDESKGRGRPLSRRRFLGNTALAAGAFTIVPRHVLGGPGHVPPSEKVCIAGIGVGGQGSSDLKRIALGEDESTPVADVQVVGLCDVDQEYAEKSYTRFPGARRYVDFREMLAAEGDKLDGVVVATPDHIHAVASMAAIKAGKHVYCEKPLTHTIHEARILTEAARKARVATQMGNQGQASEKTRRICEIIWSGAIGAVREVHVWTDRPTKESLDVYWPQGVDRPVDQPECPGTLDWDLWLGPAKERPYHPCYLPVKWRGWWDFGTGALGDMACHRMDPIFRALKLGSPSRVYATNTLVNNETYPVASMIHYEFPARGEMPSVKMTWYDGGLKPERPVELEAGLRLSSNGCLFVGDDGVMLGHTIIPESKRKSVPAAPKTLPRSVGHYREWIEACKGGAAAGSNFDIAGPLTEMVLLGNFALRPELKEIMESQKLQWDGVNMTCTNVPEANAFVHKTYREGWSL